MKKVALTSAAALLVVVAGWCQGGDATTTTTTQASISTLDHDKVVGCYFGAWAFYRKGEGHFDIDDFDPSLCTHGYYGFANLDNQTWEMTALDPWYDLAAADCDHHASECRYDSYRRFTALAKDHPNFKPILSLGGMNARAILSASPEQKKTFFDSVIPYLQTYGFQGLDLDLEYPRKEEGSDIESGKESFSDLVKQLGQILKSHDMFFSAAMSPDPKMAEGAYNFEQIVDHVDIFNVMAYDYHGWYPDHNFTGENAPLFRRKEEVEGHSGFQLNVFDSVNYYLNKGVPKEKLVVVMAAYGRGFKLADRGLNGLYCPAEDGIPKAPYTEEVGIWGYSEILSAFQGRLDIILPEGTEKWTIVVDDCYKTPYAYNGPYWIGYDDVKSIALKSQFVNYLGVAGAMIWSKDTDDFLGLYSDGVKYPLVRKINEEFASGQKFDPSNPGCQGTSPICPGMTPAPTLETTTKSPKTTSASQTTTASVPNIITSDDLTSEASSSFVKLNFSAMALGIIAAHVVAICLHCC